MAILSKIRERTVFLIIIIALALFSFVLADVIQQGDFGEDKVANYVGSVNGDEIGREAFARMVENYNQQMQGRISSMQAVNQVWDAEVNRKLLRQEFDALGLEATPALIIDYMSEQLAGSPEFSDEEGNFSERRMRAYVSNLKATSPREYEGWKEFERNIEVAVLTDMYYNLVKAGMTTTNFEARQLYKQENDNLTFQFVKIPYSSGGEVEVSKSDIKKYIEGNSENYKQKATTDIQYVFFKEEASAEDETKIKEDLEDLIQEFKTTDDAEAFISLNSDEEFKDAFQFEYDLDQDVKEQLFNLKESEVYGPYKFKNTWRASKMMEAKTLVDSAQVNHLLISFEGSQVDPQQTRTNEEAKQLADSLVNVIKADKNRFAELVSEFSADQQTKDKEGNLGKLKYGSLFDNFNGFIFDSSEEFAVLESDFGWHIVRATERTEPRKAVKLGHVAINIEPSQKTLDLIEREAKTFFIDSRESDFIELAEKADVEVKPVNEIKKLDERISGLGNQRPIIKWAFKKNTKPGETDLFETNEGFVIAQLVERREEGLKSVESVADEVTPIIKRQKQAAQLRGQISGDDLNSIAANYNVEVERASAVNAENPNLPGVGKEPKVVGAAFALQEGNVSRPVEGEKGVFVVKLLSRSEAAELPSYRAIARQENEKRVNGLQGRNSVLIQALKEAAEIEDNRFDFY